MRMDEPLLRLDDFLPYRLSVASNLVSEVIARAYRSLFDLSVAQWRVIAAAAERHGLTQQQIAQRTRMDKLTVSRATTGLVRRGLLMREPNHNDRRCHHLVLTPTGEALYADVVPKALELERRLFEGLDRQELADFRQVLFKIETIAASLD
jgi:DNA-binding MarR family transcriptional regulator